MKQKSKPKPQLQINFCEICGKILDARPGKVGDVCSTKCGEAWFTKYIYNGLI